MNELENLLNTLIKMGWKPWGKLVNTILYIHSKSMLVCLNSINEPKRQIKQDSLRELVSLESGLWQFCMENELLNSPDQYPHKDFRAKNPRHYGEMSLRWDRYYKTEVYQYRLLESALIPEEELGQFLIDNIKTE